MISNTKVTATAAAVAAGSAALLFPGVEAQAQQQPRRPLLQLQQGTTLDTLISRLGLPKRQVKKGNSTIATWSDGNQNTLNVVLDQNGAAKSWAHQGPAFSKALTVMDVAK